MEDGVIYKSAKFVKRLYKIVDDPDVGEINWSKSGKSFVIHNKERFLKNTLPLISKTKEYSAFVRLLNHYGFTKVTSINDDSEEYMHPSFVKNGEHKLMFITRVKYKHSNLNSELDSYKKESQAMKQNLEYLSSNNYRLNAELISLKERIDKQDKTISGLIEVLSRVFKAGIQSHKHRALRGENNQLENMLKDDIITSLEPQNKRRMTKEELEKCLNIKTSDISQPMLMDDNESTTDNQEAYSKDDSFSLSDFF